MALASASDVADMGPEEGLRSLCDGDVAKTLGERSMPHVSSPRSTRCASGSLSAVLAVASLAAGVGGALCCALASGETVVFIAEGVVAGVKNPCDGMLFVEFDPSDEGGESCKSGSIWTDSRVMCNTCLLLLARTTSVQHCFIP